MEGRKQGSSSSSFNDLFGSKESFGSSSSGIFGSIFAPSSKVLGRESLRSEAVDEKKLDSVDQTKPGAPDASAQSKEGEIQGTPNKDMSSFYHEEKIQPCHLSSSIYYGGQDVYSQPQNPQGYGHSSSTQSTFNKDGGEDDSGIASRGNWWQGSLYY